MKKQLTHANNPMLEVIAATVYRARPCKFLDPAKDYYIDAKWDDRRIPGFTRDACYALADKVLTAFATRTPR